MAPTNFLRFPSITTISLTSHNFSSFCLPLFQHNSSQQPQNQSNSLKQHDDNSNNNSQYNPNSNLNTQHPKIEQLNFILQTCFSSTLLLKLHALFVKNSYFQLNHQLSLSFISKASAILPRNIDYLRRILGQFSTPGIVHYNAVIKGLSWSKYPQNGLVVYRVMRGEGVVSDAMTMSLCVKCCVRSLGVVEGMQVHGRVLVDGHGRDCVLMTSLMELYSACGRCGDACKVFDEIHKRDTVTYNALISCFLNNKRTRDALAVFDGMMGLGRECRPDEVTCLLLLRACASLGALDFGKKVLDYVVENRYSGSMKISNALITMYSKCGLVDEAYEIFERMPTKGLVTWTSMISAFGMNGHGQYAVQAFWEMQRTGVAPDDQAFTAVLYACSHSGLLKEGFELFEKMTKEFGVHPNIHHYGCAVDILGRLGLLDEAYDFIRSMNVNPDAKIWRTLLAACRVYKKFGLAERVVEHIVELKAQEAGDYLLLLNTYSSNGMWDKVRKLRKFMKENRIMTTPGCSTIELKGVVNEFVADNFSHPHKDEIYKMLSEIKQQLKIAGYVPDSSSELHDLHAIEKETALSHHSEKLAIAFGVLSTPPGTTIRVANSVRTCVDCHNFAKVLSAVYNRKVIIRDRNRIHHFREGSCSCGDCW